MTGSTVVLMASGVVPFHIVSPSVAGFHLGAHCFWDVTDHPKKLILYTVVAGNTL